MKVDVKPKWILISAAAGILILGLKYMIDQSNQGSAKVNACARLCDEYRSNVIESKCHCSTEFGWIESGSLRSVLKKMSTKPEKCRR